MITLKQVIELMDDEQIVSIGRHKDFYVTYQCTPVIFFERVNKIDPDILNPLLNHKVVCLASDEEYSNGEIQIVIE